MPTLSEWCAAVARLGGSPHPAAVNEYATDLKRVDGDAVAADVQAVLTRVTQIVQHTPRDKRKASTLDALGTSLQAHPPLLAAVAADAELCALLDWALELAATDGETYINPLCTAQMATSQVKLGRFCAPFWHGLEQHGAQHLGERALATVIHRAAAMRDSGVNAAASSTEQLHPDGGIRRVLSDALLPLSKTLNAQDVANVLLAFPKLGWQLDGQLRDQLLLAAGRTSVRMEPQAVANTLWALAKLAVQPGAELQTALLGATQRESTNMGAQEVANTLWALATLQLQPCAELHAEVLDAALRVSTDMIAQDVSNTLWALATLRVQPGAELQAALLGAAQRVSSDMVAQSVSNTFWALATLRVQPGAELQAALLGRAVLVSAEMDEQHIAKKLWAVAELGLHADEATRAALCAALEREAPRMAAVGLHMTRSALQRLQWPVCGTVRRTLGMARGRSSAKAGAH